MGSAFYERPDQRHLDRLAKSRQETLEAWSPSTASEATLRCRETAVRIEICASRAHRQLPPCILIDPIVRVALNRCSCSSVS